MTNGTLTATEAVHWMLDHPMEALDGNRRRQIRWNLNLTCFEWSGSKDDWIPTGWIAPNGETFTLPEPESKPRYAETIEEALTSKRLKLPHIPGAMYNAPIINRGGSVWSAVEMCWISLAFQLGAKVEVLE